MRKLLIALVCSLTLATLGPSTLGPSVALAADSYTSPSYGYTVSWSSPWSVAEDFSDGGYDLLHLNDGLSDLYLEGMFGPASTVEQCLDDEQDRLASSGDVSDVALADGGDILTGDGVVAGSYRIFTFTQWADGEGFAEIQRSECRSLEPSAAMLVITHLALAEEYESEASIALKVTASVYIPGQLVTNTSGGNSTVERLMTNAETDLTNFWAAELPALGATYTSPAYITFLDPITTGCGDASPMEQGPFYCAADQAVYLDLEAIDQAIMPYGEFVVEFTVAHETGHHVQMLLGLFNCNGSGCANGYSNIEIELMADCFGGAWARDADERGLVEAGDVEQAIVALAAFFGDPPSTSASDPDAHGPGALRTWWFLKGYHEGAATCLDVNAGSASD